VFQLSDPVHDEIAKAIGSTVGAPLSEFSQLVADKIRYLRWKNAVTTLKKAREFASGSSKTHSAPPLKFFLPFMEGCSLEDSEFDLTDEWARLLNSASEQFRSNQLIFTRILREIGPIEARLMEKICSNDSATDHSDSDPLIGASGLEYESIGLFGADFPATIIQRIKEAVPNPVSLSEFKKSWDKITNELRSPFSAEGSCILEIAIAPEKVFDFGTTATILRYDDGAYAKFGEENTLRACDILSFHRLIEINNASIDLSGFVLDSELSAFVMGCSVTGLGADFSASCIAKK
jgi:hypothetical protein